MLPVNRLVSPRRIAACSLNAIGTGCATRSEQCVHFEIFGAQRIPFRGRHVPGTRQLAVSAADALVVVVPDRTVGLSLERRRRARGDAGRLEAVEAPLHHERGFDASRLLRVLELVERDQRERLRAERRRILEAQVGFQLGLLAVLLVPLLAGHLARPAADAVGNVDQRCPGRSRVDGFTHVRPLGDSGSSRGRAAGLDDVDEARLRFLRSRSGIRGVDREVVDARAGRQSLEAPVVRHPDDGDFLVADLQRLHARRDERLDLELTARRRDLDPVSRHDVELLGEGDRQSPASARGPAR